MRKKSIPMIQTFVFRYFLVFTAAITAGMGLAILMRVPFGSLSYLLSGSFASGAVICIGYSCFLGRLQRQEGSC